MIVFVARAAATHSVALILLFVLGVAAVVLIPFLVDLWRTYSTYQRLGEEIISRGGSLRDLAPPTGIQGLARATMALSLIALVGYALGYVLIERPLADNKTVVTNILVALTTTLAAVTAFYFGGKTAADAKATEAPSTGTTTEHGVSITVDIPAEGASFAVNEAVTPAYSCIPSPGQGITLVNVTPIDTATPGPQTFTITATDSAGHTATVSRHYTVAAA